MAKRSHASYVKAGKKAAATRRRHSRSGKRVLCRAKRSSSKRGPKGRFIKCRKGSKSSRK